MTKKDSKYCNCLYHSANAFSRVMTKLAESSFKSTGLAPSYAFLLMTVNEQPGMQPKDISCQLQLTPSTVTRLIEKLEYQGYLERKSVGRATQVFPTKKAADLKPELKKGWQNLYKAYSKVLGIDNSRTLTSLINEAYLALED